MFDSFILLTTSGVCCSVAAVLSIYWAMADEDEKGKHCFVRITDR